MTEERAPDSEEGARMTLPFGIDVSRWQGVVDWDVIAAHTPKVEFVGIRIGMSWGYIDPQFQRNWAGAKKYNIARTAYHVLYPGQGAQRQMDNLFSALPPADMGELPISLDLEMTLNQTPQIIEAEILKCADIIKTRTGRKAIMYSAASFINSYVIGNRTPMAWLNEYDWWLAHYGYQNAPRDLPPALPKGVSRERCIIHQYTSIGAPFGVQSLLLDYNRWQFDQAHLDNYIAQPQEPPTDCEALKAEIAELKAVIEEMRNGLMDIRGVTDKWY